MRTLLYSRVNPAVRGGVQSVFGRVGGHLRSQGHTVVQRWRLPHPERGATEPVLDLPLIQRRRGVPTPASVLRAMRALLSLATALAGMRPDVVNLHYATVEGMYFVLLKRLFGYKLVISVHGSDVFRPKPWDAPLLPRLLRQADAITVVSSVAGVFVRSLPGIDPDRVTVIPNGIDYEFWSAAAGPDRGVAPPTLLSVGRLHPVKGLDVLLRAMADVRQRVPGARLVIVGDGPERRALQSLADRLDIAGAVEFTGELDPVEVRARLRTARAFVLPSRSEGLPLALIEAMAAGLPVVASRVGGVPEVVVPGTGVLVPPDDPVALADELVSVLVDGERGAALARQARERAREFTASAANLAYERVLCLAAGRQAEGAGPGQRR